MVGVKKIKLTFDEQWREFMKIAFLSVILLLGACKSNTNSSEVKDVTNKEIFTDINSGAVWPSENFPVKIDGNLETIFRSQTNKKLCALVSKTTPTRFFVWAESSDDCPVDGVVSALKFGYIPRTAAIETLDGLEVGKVEGDGADFELLSLCSKTTQVVCDIGVDWQGHISLKKK